MAILTWAFVSTETVCPAQPSTLHNPTVSEPVRSSIGTSFLVACAPPLAGGRRVSLPLGEIQIIPPGLGHVWTEVADGGIDYLVFRIDPEHVLALST
jgi:hypothetical protein